MRRSIALMLVVVVVVGLVSAACSSGDDAGETPESSATTEASSTDSAGTDTGGTEEAAAAPGVTDDTIKIGFTYLDLSEIGEIIDVNHGPYDQHMQALVDDLNANGGISGRMVEVTSIPFDPVGAEAQQAVCLEFTEDEQVFAVLGSVRGDNVLCYTEQHDTVAVTADFMTDERRARSVAPYVTAAASSERVLTSFVDTAVDQGLLEGKTVAVHSTEPANHALVTDLVVPQLEAAGIDVVFESLIEAGGADVGSASEAAALNAEAMRGKGVDAVVVVGETLVIANAFIGVDYFPTMLFGDMSSALGLAADADLSVFDAVHTFGNYPNTYRYDEQSFQDECVPVWDAAHPDDPVVDPDEVADGEPNHTVGLGVACRSLTILVKAAEAAGAELNNETFLEGVQSIGEFLLPGHGPASLAEGKYDAQDDLLLWVYDPAEESNRGFVLVES
jgi:hypothetical protein